MRNTKSNPARKTFGKTLTAGLDRIDCGNCGKSLPRSLDYVLCPPCWKIHKICKEEGVEKLSEIVDPRRSREELLGRVSDLIRRTGVEDAEHLIRRLERLSS